MVPQCCGPLVVHPAWCGVVCWVQIMVFAILFFLGLRMLFSSLYSLQQCLQERKRGRRGCIELDCLTPSYWRNRKAQWNAQRRSAGADGAASGSTSPSYPVASGPTPPPGAGVAASTAVASGPSTPPGAGVAASTDAHTESLHAPVPAAAESTERLVPKAPTPLLNDRDAGVDHDDVVMHAIASVNDEPHGARAAYAPGAVTSHDPSA